MLTHQNAATTRPGRAVVIGAGGFVGSTIVRELAVADIPTLALTRKEVDLLASRAAQELAQHLDPLDAVVFVSAVAPTKDTDQLLANLRMAKTACTAFNVTAPAHLVYISSDAVYADQANPVTEASPVAPSTMHGMMHAARELIFRTEYRGPFACLRPTLIYGARDPHSGYGPNRFRRQATNGEPITIFGAGEEQRDHVAVEDVGRLVVRILLRRSTGVLNSATSVATSFRDIAHIIAEQSSPPAAVRSVPRRGPRPHLLHRFFDITNVHKAFPDFHFEPIAVGLARVHRQLAAETAQINAAKFNERPFNVE